MVIPDSVIPLSTYTLYLIPDLNFHVIHDPVIPLSVITLSTSLLYLIPLYQILLCQFPVSNVIPVIPDSVMTGSPSPGPAPGTTLISTRNAGCSAEAEPMV